MQAFLTSLRGFPRPKILQADAALLGLVIAILAMMILPMPTILIDVLIGLNLSITVVLLVVALQINTPLKLSSFPTLLLLSTLFRLALSISTTRLILLQGDAGSVIRTFGDFVVGGNMIVGLIVFLILTLVQFIVITKGAERVAEVGARFSLDGMPGKQMSIDGDVRAGSVTKEDAKERRGKIEIESKFYGAMDGAMKFVKGDAIAGLIIVAINLLGGVGVAVLQRGMDFSTAIQNYSILTIGDGLVSQIPALLTSIAAGLIVTRVAQDGDKPTNIGQDIVFQLFTESKPLIFGGLVMSGIAFLPGMPMVTFMILASSLILLGVWRLISEHKKAKDSKDEVGTDGVRLQNEDGTSTGYDDAKGQVFSVPLVISLAPSLRDHHTLAALSRAVTKTKNAKSFELGIPFPDILLRIDETLPSHSCAMHLNEVPVASWRIPPGCVLAQYVDIPLPERDHDGEFDDVIPDAFPESIWVEARHAELLRSAGSKVLDELAFFSTYIGVLLERNAADLFGLQETCSLLTSLETTCPDLIKECDRIMPKTRVAEVLQRLLAEGISVRNLKRILETLIRWGGKEKDPLVLTEYARVEMKRQIVHKCSGTSKVLTVYLLSHSLEETLRAAVRQTSSGSYAVLEPNQTKQLLEAVKTAVGDLRGRRVLPVLLTQMDIRRYLRKLIEAAYPELAVIAHQELTQDIELMTVGEIDIALS
ncbi:type III secretion system export apparatus subunit SctV [Glaciimonas sp. GG7]